MVLSTTIANAAGIIAAVLTVLSQAAFWQQKEYRFDRARAVAASSDIRTAHLVYGIAAALVVLGWAGVYILNSSQGNHLGLLSLAILLTYAGKRSWVRGISRPRLTAKAFAFIAVHILVIGVYTAAASFTPLTGALYWATMVILLPISSLFAVVITNALSSSIKHRTMVRAIKHRDSLQLKAVIGITGSYGKTSTKHFLSQLMPSAQASKQHRNSEFVIAQDMLEQLTTDSTTYIAELSAYRTGEIADLARITKPTIGVITAIGNQHLALFGSQQEIIDAKWELIESLPHNGIAVLNKDDPALQQKAKTFSGRILWFSTTQPADAYVSDVNYQPDAIMCTLHISDRKHSIKLPLAGEANLASAVAAAAVARAAGQDESAILKHLPSLKPYPRTMELVDGPNGSRIIDDSYSANEAGVHAAIRHLQRFPQSDKRVAIVPLIELGSDSAAVHTGIGRALAKTGAKVYVFGASHRHELSGTGYTDPKKFVSDTTADLSAETVILVEGRVPELLRSALGLS